MRVRFGFSNVDGAQHPEPASSPSLLSPCSLPSPPYSLLRHTDLSLPLIRERESGSQGAQQGAQRAVFTCGASRVASRRISDGAARPAAGTRREPGLLLIRRTALQSARRRKGIDAEQIKATQ